MSSSVRKRKSIEHWKIIAFYLIIYDIVAINFSYFFGLLLRFDLAYSSIPENYLSAFLRFAPFYTAFSLIVFYVAHMYNSVWRFASFTELNRIFVATVVTTVFQVVGITTFYERMPGSYYIVIVIGNPLKLSPGFPPLHTGHATFTASGVPSSIVSAVIHNHSFTLAKFATLLPVAAVLR